MSYILRFFVSFAVVYARLFDQETYNLANTPIFSRQCGADSKDTDGWEYRRREAFNAALAAKRVAERLSSQEERYAADRNARLSAAEARKAAEQARNPICELGESPTLRESVDAGHILEAAAVLAEDGALMVWSPTSKPLTYSKYTYWQRNMAWLISLIVLGSLLIIIGLILAFWYCYRRHRNEDQPITYVPPQGGLQIVYV